MNDPVHIASQSPGSIAETLQLTRSELESLCAKAARGAGMSWGLAEEAAYACGWMAGRGLDGAGVLAMHLLELHGKDWRELGPVLRFDERWIISQNQAMCPVSLGATLSDFACVDQTLFDKSGLRIDELRYPFLLLPFIAMVAEDLKKTLYVQIENHRVCVEPDARIPAFSDDIQFLKIAAVIIYSDINASVSDTVSLLKHSDTASKQPVLATPTPVPFDALTFLHQLALQTTVPSSAASRANAGAQSSDND